ncbi:glutaminyl cyclase, partial [Cryptococcus neoformans]
PVRQCRVDSCNKKGATGDHAHIIAMILLLVYLYSLLVLPVSAHQSRSYNPLSISQLKRVIQLGPPQFSSVTDGHLGKLLIPRPSGSENNTLVQNYISSVFSKLGWHEEKTPFTSATPIGDIDFTNLVYTFDPDAPRRLVLAAHFDSKWYPDYPASQFIGATDSAAPCAILLSIAEFLTPFLNSRQSRISSGQPILRDGFDEEEEAETTVQIIFFDGEEAFHDWTDTDSIYGARYLAEEWSETYLPPAHPLTRRRMQPHPTVLSTIDHLVLFDLLGNKHSSIRSFFRETDWLFDHMASGDERLREEGLVEVEKGEDGWFRTERGRKGMVGDDHVPFLDRGVSVLHVISVPFPSVWHTIADDTTALSLPAIRRWNRILRVFVCEYLSLFPEDIDMSLDRDIDMDMGSDANEPTASTISTPKTRSEDELVGIFFHPGMDFQGD